MRFTCAAIVTGLVGVTNLQAQIDQELLQQARRNWRELERAGRNVEVAYTFSIREAGRPAVEVDKRVLIGGDRILIRSNESAIRRRLNDSIERVVAINSSYSFRLGRKRDSSDFSITSFGQPDEELRSHLASETVASAGAPWSFLKPLPRLVDDSTFKIASIRYDFQRGKRVIVIKAKYTPLVADAALPALNGVELTLDPDTSWSILGYKAEIAQGALSGVILTGIIEHTPNAENLPIPTSYTLTHSDKQQGDRIYGTKFTKWEYRKFIPEEEFTLSAFGLPEPVGSAIDRRSIPRYIWFLIGAGVFAVVAILFRWLTRRNRAVHPTP